MKTAPSIVRLIAEILAIVAPVECSVMFLLPLIAPGLGRSAESMLDAAMLTLGAAPLLLWRVRAWGVALASRMTADLAASEERARAALAVVSAYRAALVRHAIVAVTDPSGTITEVNDNFCRISGYSREELIGAKHSIVNSGFHPKAFWTDMWRTVAGRKWGVDVPTQAPTAADAKPSSTPDGGGTLHGGPPAGAPACPAPARSGPGPDGIWRAEVCNRAKDGTLYWVDTSIGPVRDEAGKTVGFVSIRFDITDRKQAESLLRYSYENLERHVAERTEMLAEAVHTAEAASRAKSEFLAHMSHEIRTPINGVAGMLSLLAGTSLDQQQQRFVDLARTSVGNLTSVINDILDFSKIEAGKLDIVHDDFNLVDAIEDVVQMLVPRAQEKGLEITCAVASCVPRRVRGDPDRLRQILTNLVGNAIKFTRRGAVVIRAVLDEASAPAGGDEGGALVRVTVSDTGIGIPQDRLDRLFKPFSQADSSTTREYGGTGLGLAICKRLAELMGGAIGVASEEGRGSTFWFTIAFAGARPLAGAAPGGAVPHSLAPHRLLLVGGSASQRDLLCEQCRSWGMRVSEAENSDQGLATLVHGAQTGDPFALAIVDSALGDAAPFELAAAVRRDPRLRGTTLLFQHPMTTPFDPGRLSAAGFLGDLATPVRQSQLLDALMIATASSGLAPAAPSAAEPLPHPSTPRAGGLRVLVAEDNEINQIVAREMLTRAGCEVEVVGNGRLAVDAVRRATFDLVLMDCQMPELDGYDATREIRRLEQDRSRTGGRRLPIVALTANAMQGDRERCLEAGMDDHVSKPIDPAQLFGVIDRVMRAGPGLPLAA